MKSTAIPSFKWLQGVTAVFTLVSLAALSVMASSPRGGVDTGGGTFIRVDGQIGLLDLYLYNPTVFKDLTPGEKLPRTEVFRTLGFDKFNLQNDKVMLSARSQLNLWKASSPIIVSEVERALRLLPFYYFRGTIKKPAERFVIPERSTVNAKDLGMIASFEKPLGALVSQETFEALSERNQVATVIHETLRFIQINMASGLSDDGIQKLTARLMSAPSPGQSLDTAEYLQQDLLLRKSRKDRATLQFFESSKQACKAHGQLCEVATFTVKDFDDFFAGKPSLLLSAVVKFQKAEKQDDVGLNAVDLLLAYYREVSILDAATELKYSAGNFGRELIFSNFDMALQDINEHGWSQSSYKDILLFAKQAFIKIGLM